MNLHRLMQIAIKINSEHNRNTIIPHSLQLIQTKLSVCNAPKMTTDNRLFFFLRPTERILVSSDTLADQQAAKFHYTLFIRASGKATAADVLFAN